MRNYEAMFIFRPDVVDEKLEKEVKSVERLIKTKGKGDVTYSVVGKKNLAYEIKKNREGIYVNYVFTADPTAIEKIKGSLKHKENILRSMFLVRGE
jgi:small subunit ribosomal protein S6